MLLALIAASLVQSAGPPPGDGVRVVADVDYVPEAAWEDDRDRLDLYLPVGRQGFPVVVWIHGGALRSGSKAGAAHVGRTLAAAGVGTIAINHRLSPQVRHPVHAQDAARAVAWARRHLKEYGGDPGALFLGGHSSGAYLAALLALDGRYLAANQLQAADLAGVVTVSGFFWVEEIAPVRPKDVWGADPGAWPAASPSRYVRSDAPPFLLIDADGEEAWRRSQNERMATALRRAGHASVETRQVKGRDHLTINDRFGPGDEVGEAVLGFVTRRAGAAR
jgi:acetyl esterase/lipase